MNTEGRGFIPRGDVSKNTEKGKNKEKSEQGTKECKCAQGIGRNDDVEEDSRS